MRKRNGSGRVDKDKKYEQNKLEIKNIIKGGQKDDHKKNEGMKMNEGK